jgi:hypothetical protein
MYKAAEHSAMITQPLVATLLQVLSLARVKDVRLKHCTLQHSGSNSRYPLPHRRQGRTSVRVFTGREWKVTPHKYLRSHGLTYGIPTAGTHAKGFRPTARKK